MNWFKKIRSILGYFWCEFWQDSWLVELIIKIYTFIVGESIQSRLQQIYKQTTVNTAADPDYIYPIRVLVSRQPSSNIISVSQLNIGSSELNESDSGFLYDVHSYISQDIVGFKTSVDSSVQSFDFKYYPDSNKLFSSVDLQKAGFKPSLQNVNGVPEECLVLWADYKQYNTLRDNFSWVLQLPIQWLYKYPGIIPLSWTMKHTGATVQLVQDFFSCMGITSQVYRGQQGLPDKQTLAGVYVLTQSGYLFADNSDSKSLNSGNLPLKTKPNGALSSDYVDKCHQLQSSDIYVNLPSSLNPAKYIFQQLWGASAGLIVLDSTVNKTDMAIAVRFIAKNVVKGAILQIYTKDANGVPALLYPDKDKAQQLIFYYNNSINNQLIQDDIPQESDSESSSSGEPEEYSGLYVMTTLPQDTNTWKLESKGWAHVYIVNDKTGSHQDGNNLYAITELPENSNSWSLVAETWPQFYIVSKRSTNNRDSAQV